MASAARAWNDALKAARACASELDAMEAMGTLDEDGEGTWKLVEILLSKLRGQSIPLLDRITVDAEWRRVLLVVEEGASEGKLHFCGGEVVVRIATLGHSSSRGSGSSVGIRWSEYL